MAIQSALVGRTAIHGVPVTAMQITAKSIHRCPEAANRIPGLADGQPSLLPMALLIRFLVMPVTTGSWPRAPVKASEEVLQTHPPASVSR